MITCIKLFKESLFNDKILIQERKKKISKLLINNITDDLTTIIDKLKNAFTFNDVDIYHNGESNEANMFFSINDVNCILNIYYNYDSYIIVPYIQNDNDEYLEWIDNDIVYNEISNMIKTIKKLFRKKPELRKNIKLLNYQTDLEYTENNKLKLLNIYETELKNSKELELEDNSGELMYIFDNIDYYIYINVENQNNKCFMVFTYIVDDVEKNGIPIRIFNELEPIQQKIKAN